MLKRRDKMLEKLITGYPALSLMLSGTGAKSKEHPLSL